MNSESGETYEKSKPNDGTKKMPPIPSDPSPITEVPAHDTKNEATNETDWQRRHYRVQLALVFVGVGVAFIYACQLNEMMKSTNAATKAAVAAENSVKLTREMGHLDQRAWVGIIGVTGTPTLNNPFLVQVLTKNSGKTFAKKCRSMVYFQDIPAGTEPDFSHDNTRYADNSVATIAPNAELGTNTDVLRYEETKIITQSMLDNWKNGQSTFMVCEKITYEDIFGCEHWTTFCAYLAKDLTYKTYREHNDADNNRSP